MRLVARVKEAGEWQLRSILRLPVEEHFLDGRTELHTYTSWLDLLGWSTPSQAYWTDYETAIHDYARMNSEQCRDVHPASRGCTLRFPYDPYRYLIGAPAEAPAARYGSAPPPFALLTSAPAPASSTASMNSTPLRSCRPNPPPRSPLPPPRPPSPSPSPSPSPLPPVSSCPPAACGWRSGMMPIPPNSAPLALLQPLLLPRVLLQPLLRPRPSCRPSFQPHGLRPPPHVPS